MLVRCVRGFGKVNLPVTKLTIAEMGVLVEDPACIVPPAAIVAQLNRLPALRLLPLVKTVEILGVLHNGFKPLQSQQREPLKSSIQCDTDRIPEMLNTTACFERIHPHCVRQIDMDLISPGSIKILAELHFIHAKRERGGADTLEFLEATARRVERGFNRNELRRNTHRLFFFAEILEKVGLGIGDIDPEAVDAVIVNVVTAFLDCVPPAGLGDVIPFEVSAFLRKITKERRVSSTMFIWLPKLFKRCDDALQERRKVAKREDTLFKGKGAINTMVTLQPCLQLIRWLLRGTADKFREHAKITIRNMLGHILWELGTAHFAVECQISAKRCLSPKVSALSVRLAEVVDRTHPVLIEIFSLGASPRMNQLLAQYLEKKQHVASFSFELNATSAPSLLRLLSGVIILPSGRKLDIITPYTNPPQSLLLNKTLTVLTEHCESYTTVQTFKICDAINSCIQKVSKRPSFPNMHDFCVVLSYHLKALCAEEDVQMVVQCLALIWHAAVLLSKVSKSAVARIRENLSAGFTVLVRREATMVPTLPVGQCVTISTAVAASNNPNIQEKNKDFNYTLRIAVHSLAITARPISPLGGLHDAVGRIRAMSIIIASGAAKVSPSVDILRELIDVVVACVEKVKGVKGAEWGENDVVVSNSVARLVKGVVRCVEVRATHPIRASIATLLAAVEFEGEWMPGLEERRLKELVWACSLLPLEQTGKRTEGNALSAQLAWYVLQPKYLATMDADWYRGCVTSFERLRVAFEPLMLAYHSVHAQTVPEHENGKRPLSERIPVKDV